MTVGNEIELDQEWSFIELLGYRRVAGRVTTVRLGGVAMLQVDVPIDDESSRRLFYGAGSLYCLTPATEAEVRAYLKPTPELEEFCAESPVEV